MSKKVKYFTHAFECILMLDSGWYILDIIRNDRIIFGWLVHPVSFNIFRVLFSDANNPVMHT